MKTELTVDDLKMIWMLLELLKAKHLREGGYKVHEHDELGNKVWQVLRETEIRFNISIKAEKPTEQ